MAAISLLAYINLALTACDGDEDISSDFGNVVQESTANVSGTPILLWVALLILLLCVILLALYQLIQQQALKKLNAKVEKVKKVLKEMPTTSSKTAPSEINKINKNLQTAVEDTNKNFKQILKQVTTLEKQVAALQPASAPSPAPSNTPKAPSSKPTNEPKIGYFAYNKGDVIITVSDVQTSESVYKAYYKNEKEAEFEPCDIGAIKTVNDLERAVNYKGKSLKDATAMNVTKRGKAVREQDSDGNSFWIIMEKAEIELG